MLYLMFVVVFGIKVVIFLVLFWLLDFYLMVLVLVMVVFVGLLMKVGVYVLICIEM